MMDAPQSRRPAILALFVFLTGALYLVWMRPLIEELSGSVGELEGIMAQVESSYGSQLMTFEELEARFEGANVSAAELAPELERFVERFQFRDPVSEALERPFLYNELVNERMRTLDEIGSARKDGKTTFEVELESAFVPENLESDVMAWGRLESLRVVNLLAIASEIDAVIQLESMPAESITGLPSRSSPIVVFPVKIRVRSNWESTKRFLEGLGRPSSGSEESEQPSILSSKPAMLLARLLARRVSNEEDMVETSLVAVGVWLRDSNGEESLD